MSASESSGGDAQGEMAMKPRGDSDREATAEAGVAAVEFGRESCGVLEVAEQREWLVTNGIGGYASGTVSGNLTRRYHGLLVAALQPPVGRTVLVAKVDEIARYDGSDFALSTNRWASGTVEPGGFVNLESFRLDGAVPVFRFAMADALVEKRVWMQQGANTTYVQYSMLRGSEAVELRLKVLVNYRDFHGNTHAGDWRMRVDPVADGVRIVPRDDAAPFYLRSAGTICEPRNAWYRDCLMPAETARGLDDREDVLCAAVFRAELRAGETVTLVFSTEADASLDGAAGLAQNFSRETELFDKWKIAVGSKAKEAPRWIRQLVLAADQFIVSRALPEEPDGKTILAGYHWFADWGRDTMIALPGLTLATGRADVARKILLAFSRYVDGGMLPNNFPDAGGGAPQYNTVDAALWYVEAVRQYFEATADRETLVALFPVLEQIIAGYSAGTRYQIHVDPADGLLYAGEAGVQITWMDAKIGDWVVTPRVGKPVEINALWFNALHSMAGFAARLGKSGERYAEMAARVLQNFGKFWNEAAGCCFDVIDVPGGGKDGALRPNQIFAVALPQSALSEERQKAVVDVCARELLTSFGLRSLAPGDPAYQGHYNGDQRHRDGAYHQGTAWGWLLGPFVMAHFRVYKDADAARGFLEPLGKHIDAYGLGTLAEIFDGDAPFAAGGCIAQAWTVGEVLRAWHAVAG
jgi:predicted glycogen debranching enzyme